MVIRFNDLHWSKDREKQQTLLDLKKKGNWQD